MVNERGNFNKKKKKIYFIDNSKPPKEAQKCCACGEAKYLMTFNGIWSKSTHPKDWPENGWNKHLN